MFEQKQFNGFSSGTWVFHRIVGQDNLSGVIIQVPLIIYTVIGDKVTTIYVTSVAHYTDQLARIYQLVIS